MSPFILLLIHITTQVELKRIMLRQQKPISFFTGLSSRKPKSLLAEIRAALVPMFIWSVASNSATPGIAHQAPLSIVFPRQEHWSGLPFPPPGDLPDPGIEPMSLASPALADEFLTTGPLGKPMDFVTKC